MNRLVLGQGQIRTNLVIGPRSNPLNFGGDQKLHPEIMTSYLLFAFPKQEEYLLQVEF